ncbi:S41 family peptidase [Sphingomicrobium nitratireducens]|uniref:S41 family peptidase n=1 Tax=Sphingomicrobium nitratireducens TaxID=2964666 RepID=UPI00223F4BFE|nr:S41 family peptidase [Sphingomicrobium nitratireducens]
MLRTLLLAATAFLSTPALAADPVDWKAITTGDVEAAYRTFVDNHPGWLDPTNPGFRDQLDAARSAALAVANEAEGPGAYDEALAAFSTILADGHAKVRALSSGTAEGGEKSLLWPGFVVAWRGNEARIFDVAPGSAFQRGSRLTACDGTPIKQWIRTHGPALGMRSTAPGHWWSITPRLFAQFDNIDPIAERCSIVTPGGEAKTVALDWSEAPADLFDRFHLASDGDELDVGLTEPAPGIHWIALPTFNPDDEDAARYDALYADLSTKHGAIVAGRAVVIDLRGNDGGSSTWSHRVAASLWGEDAVARRIHDYFAKVSVWHRASEGNIRYLEEARETYADRPEILAFINDLYAPMTAARDKGEDFYVVPASDPEEEEQMRGTSPASDFATPVFVIVPGRCASACLDALDTFTRFENVTLVGAPSASDTTYMEVRTEALPSGRGQIVIPIKFWHNRPRGSGEAYYPAIRHDGLDWTTEAFLALIEKQLD